MCCVHLSKWSQGYYGRFFFQPSFIHGWTSAFCLHVQRCRWREIGPFSATLSQRGLAEHDYPGKNTPPWLGIEPGPQGGQTVIHLFLYWAIMTELGTWDALIYTPRDLRESLETVQCMRGLTWFIRLWWNTIKHVWSTHVTEGDPNCCHKKVCLNDVLPDLDLGIIWS